MLRGVESNRGKQRFTTIIIIIIIVICTVTGIETFLYDFCLRIFGAGGVVTTCKGKLS